jgi:GDP-L-fucose synthase
MPRDPQPAFPLKGRRVWLAGHGGLLGSALRRRLEREDCEVVFALRADLDLRRADDALAFARDRRPEAVILSAARAGGVQENLAEPAAFLADNLQIATSVMAAAQGAGTEKLLFVASAAIYPRNAPQPTPEEALMTGPLDPALEGYALAKIAGLKLAQAYRARHGLDAITAAPCNLYGEDDRFDEGRSTVLAALVRRAVEARAAGSPTLTVWGSGRARRELLHADDAADAMTRLLTTYSDAAPVNVGCGQAAPIADLARMIARAAGFRGEVVFDATKPEGAPSKRLDVTRLFALGWRPQVALADGIARVVRRYAERRTV